MIIVTFLSNYSQPDYSGYKSIGSGQFLFTKRQIFFFVSGHHNS